ncbi:flagellar motor switch protein FliN [Rhizobium sp. TH2]|uniref:flagellar motor switch protein FliN n=1 Tax=Rhizobium sp. TH2 TaxID=2775403 RepID=UPI002156FBA2|nr:flagellar motor switch protein FliN [Rhizobium sp. TH2]UVC09930.1 flagellar motor switch protein FliN [Rhizobium sp. TH2]
MAPKKAKLEDQALETPGIDAELDQAIDDLRGVLDADASGGAALDNDFGADFPAATTDTSFGGDFGLDTDAESDIGSDFGLDGDTASDFGSEFGASTSFGGDTGLGGNAFGGNDFGAAPSFNERQASEPGSSMNSNLDMIMDIPIDVQIVLGSSRMQVSGLMNLTEGATISLDRKIGEPVDLVVNGRLIGRGEITVLENDETRFGIRLIEVMAIRKS